MIKLKIYHLMLPVTLTNKLAWCLPKDWNVLVERERIKRKKCSIYFYNEHASSVQTMAEEARLGKEGLQVEHCAIKI